MKHQVSGGEFRQRNANGVFRLFSLHRDQAEDATIDAAIRGNVQLAGTNLWILMLAIVIASVGLNVNSTAVIIGAMLISPLMGPIIGIGYGAAIYDYALIRLSFRNLAVFVTISLFASTLYFLLSPLTQAHSELLARTSPAIWDVVIAFAGGAAGMIGISRKEKSSVIPGVAIATALMPPICTAGYGIATMQPRFFVGAFYLFLINGVFIAMASLLIARILRLQQYTFPNESTRQRGRIVIAVAVLGTLVPSVYFAGQMVREELFMENAGRFLRMPLFDSESVSLLAHEVDPKQRRLTLTMIGQGVTTEFEKELNSQLGSFGLSGSTLKIRHPSEARTSDTLARNQKDDLLHQAVVTSQEGVARISALERRIRIMENNSASAAGFEKGILAQYRGLRTVEVSVMARTTENGELRERVLVAVEPVRAFGSADVERLRHWLAERLPKAEIVLAVGKIPQ